MTRTLPCSLATREKITDKDITPYYKLMAIYLLSNLHEGNREQKTRQAVRQSYSDLGHISPRDSLGRITFYRPFQDTGFTEASYHLL